MGRRRLHRPRSSFLALSADGNQTYHIMDLDPFVLGRVIIFGLSKQSFDE